MLACTMTYKIYINVKELRQEYKVSALICRTLAWLNLSSQTMILIRKEKCEEYFHAIITVHFARQPFPCVRRKSLIEIAALQRLCKLYIPGSIGYLIMLLKLTCLSLQISFSHLLLLYGN